MLGIVGHVLAELGAVQDFDESVRVGDYTFPNSEGAASICWDVFDVEEPDPIEETFLVMVQGLQDEGSRWGVQSRCRAGIVGHLMDELFDEGAHKPLESF